MSSQLIEANRDLVLRIAHKNLSTYAEEKPRLEMLISLLGLVEGHHFYFISDKGYAEDLWDNIRKDRRLTHFILACAAEYKLRFPGQPADWETVIGKLTEAFARDYVRGGAYDAEIIMDEDTREMMPERDTLKKLIYNNSWLVYLLLLSTVSPNEIAGPHLQEILKQRQENAERAGRRGAPARNETVVEK